jgi:hypothetical protein
LEAVEDFMAAEGFMGVAVTLLGVILAAVDMGGAAAVTAGEVVTGAAGTVDAVGMVVVGTGAAGMVVVGIGMAVLPTGGGVTHTRMVTDLMVGNGDKQKNLNRDGSRFTRIEARSAGEILASRLSRRGLSA